MSTDRRPGGARFTLPYTVEVEVDARPDGDGFHAATARLFVGAPEGDLAYTTSATLRRDPSRALAAALEDVARWVRSDEAPNRVDNT